jgi:hypothetical protein
MNSEQTKLDKFLEDALKNYSDAEPRIGFESRIVANLRTAPVKPLWLTRFVYATAAMVTLSAVLYGSWQIGRTVSGSSSQDVPPTVASRAPAPNVARMPEVVVSAPKHNRFVKARTQPIRNQQLRMVLSSRLPAARPLSNQEKLLLAFARENPKEVLSTVEWQEQMRQRPKNPDLPDQGEQQ